MSAHDFKDHNSVVGGDCVTEAQDCVDDCVASGVKTNGEIGVAHIVVDGCRDADDTHIRHFVDVLKASKRAVATDDHQMIASTFQKVVHCLFHHFGLAKVLASACAKDSAPSVHAVGHTVVLHFKDVVFNKTNVATSYTIDGVALCHCIADHCTDASIHT